MSRKISLVLATAIAMVLMTAGVASATPLPPSANCSSGRNLTSYNSGYRIGVLTVNQAYASAGVTDPDDFDAFAHTVRNIFHTAIHNLGLAGPSDFVQCRAKGMAQAACDRLSELANALTAACLLDGTAWGDLSGELYCALSDAFGGLDVTGLLPNPPDGLCGQAFEEACGDQFVSYATTSPANFCAPYTTGTHAAVYAEAQINMCIYETP